MLRATIQRLDDPIRRTTEPAGLIPAGWAVNAIETVEFYRRYVPDGFPWGRTVRRRSIQSGGEDIVAIRAGTPEALDAVDLLLACESAGDFEGRNGSWDHVEWVSAVPLVDVEVAVKREHPMVT